MKLSNFNFQRTKTLYQYIINYLDNFAFFFTFFKGYRYNKLSVILTPKTISHGCMASFASQIVFKSIFSCGKHTFGGWLLHCLTFFMINNLIII